MRTTLADALNSATSRIPARLGMCADDPRLVAFINSAQQRLLNEGKWWGTVSKFAFCSTGGCLTLPPQIATVEAVAVCHNPIPVRDYWYEFLENGSGTRSSCSCWPEAVYRGRFPVFTDITGIDKKLRWICDVAADIGQKALFLGYDNNGNWVRTQDVSGAWRDGEVLTAAQSPGSTSVNIFSKVTDIQFSGAMSGQSWLYSLSTTDATLIMLGHYQAFETRPAYARYLFPSLQRCAGSKPVLVEAMCKLEFIPAVNPADYLIISNLPALEEMCNALNKAENEPDSTKANAITLAGMAVAKKLLDAELDQYLGSGRTIGINVQGSGMPDGCAVENLV